MLWNDLWDIMYAWYIGTRCMSLRLSCLSIDDRWPTVNHWYWPDFAGKHRLHDKRETVEGKIDMLHCTRFTCHSVMGKASIAWFTKRYNSEVWQYVIFISVLSKSKFTWNHHHHHHHYMYPKRRYLYHIDSCAKLKLHLYIFSSTNELLKHMYKKLWFIENKQVNKKNGSFNFKFY